jgi:Prealbumin-like fold domain
MNNTTTRGTLTAIVVLIFAAGSLLAITTTSTPSTIFAYAKKGTQDNGNVNNNGNTDTIQAARQGAGECGFDVTQEQESQNVICTHPKENATCSQEGVTSTPSISIPTPTPQPTTGTLLVKKVVECSGGGSCPRPSEFTITVFGNDARPFSFSGSTEGTPVTLRPGFYNVTETDFGQIAGFTLSRSGDCEGTIAADDQKTCTIINTQQPIAGTLIIIKNVVCRSTDPNCAVPSDFTIAVFQPEQPVQTVVGKNGAGTVVTLVPGMYRVMENTSEQFNAILSGQCSGDIAAGQQLICTITNTETQPTMQVRGQGEGQSLCPPPATVIVPNASLGFSAQQIGGAVQGQFDLTLHFANNDNRYKTGTLNNIQINGDGSFTVTGTELTSPCDGSRVPTTVTISGQCGTGIPILYMTADGERATFTGNVACT